MAGQIQAPIQRKVSNIFAPKIVSLIIINFLLILLETLFSKIYVRVLKKKTSDILFYLNLLNLIGEIDWWLSFSWDYRLLNEWIIIKRSSCYQSITNLVIAMLFSNYDKSKKLNVNISPESQTNEENVYATSSLNL